MRETSEPAPAKRVVAVDLVGTLIDNWPLKREWLRRRGFDLPTWQPPKKDIVAIVGPNVYEEMKAAVITTGSIESDQPIEGAADAVATLAEKFRIVVLSTRSEQHREPTVRALRAHFGNAVQSLVLLGGAISDTAKVRWCVDNDAFALIDDDDRHLAFVPPPFLAIFLNLHERPVVAPPAAVLARSWADAVEIIMSRAQSG